MTIQDWAIIVIAISAPIAAFATLLAPSLAEIVKFRISQPKPSPDPNQPENLIQRKVGRSLKRTFWFPALLAAADLVMLIWLIRSPMPLDKAFVVTASLLVSSFMIIVFIIALAYILTKIWAALFDTGLLQLQAHKITTERIENTEEWLSVLTTSLTASFNNDTKRAKGLLAALRLAKGVTSGDSPSDVEQ